LESTLRCDPLGLHAVVGLPGLKVLVFFGSAIRPLDHDPVNMIVLAEAECERQFRLREIARTTLYHARLSEPANLYAHSSADRVPVGLSTKQSKTDAMVPAPLIVSEQVSGAMV